jgi:hypothetical protein
MAKSLETDCFFKPNLGSIVTGLYQEGLIHHIDGSFVGGDNEGDRAKGNKWHSEVSEN